MNEMAENNFIHYIFSGNNDCLCINLAATKSYLMIHPARSKDTAPWYTTSLHLSSFDIKANDLHRYWLTIPEKKHEA